MPHLQPLARSGTQAGQSASTHAYPPPVLGLNTKDALPFLKPGHAIVLDNWWTAGNELQTRRGAVLSNTLADIATYASLAIYHGLTAQQLIAFGSFGAASVDLVNNELDNVSAVFKGPAATVNFATAAGQFLLAVNGIESMIRYDGSAWTQITDTTTPSITGIATSLFDLIAAHQRRVWLGEKNSLNAWYLPVDQFAGVASKFSLGSVFTRGGKLANIFTWSVDAGNGQDDLLCFYTTAGEVAVYSGIDPGAPETWSLVGVYFVGEPVAGAPVEKFGGDVVLLTVRGIFLLSQALQSTSLSNRFALSDLINPTFQSIAALYADQLGWGVNVLPNLDMMLITTPTGIFAANVTNKSWHRFIGWGEVTSGVVFNQLPMFIHKNKSICKAWIGSTDYGADITATAVQAPQRLHRSQVQKLISMMRPTLRYQSNFLIRAGIAKDYDIDSVYYDYQVGQPAGVGVWDASTWNEAVWGAGARVWAEWITVPQEPAAWVSPTLQVVTRNDIVRWLSTDIMFHSGGIM